MNSYYIVRAGIIYEHEIYERAFKSLQSQVQQGIRWDLIDCFIIITDWEQLLTHYPARAIDPSMAQNCFMRWENSGIEAESEMYLPSHICTVKRVWMGATEWIG